ncbi:hypothetical protein RHSIM_Rhsim07G0000600 [Rhododendron simsii]|uniref:Uncharacterized protein n=1 Tax=Rhododendron simsii TaxID=118357 RepID=A0A834GSZ4_RHOSS|nr:hypothetical protein RHSIM_Rhsim07G0000600 [Rhododendron simsii]
MKKRILHPGKQSDFNMNRERHVPDKLAETSYLTERMTRDLTPSQVGPKKARVSVGKKISKMSDRNSDLEPTILRKSGTQKNPVWKKRNSRMFRQHGMDHSALVKCIWDEIKAGVSSWRNVLVSAGNQDCCVALGLNPAIFAKASCA